VTAADLERTLEFLRVADGLKNVQRRNLIADGSRRENTAEHSWHLLLMALVLRDLEPKADALRVLELLIVHDLVEIHADDTFLYDLKANASKLEREQLAANQIFGLLPDHLHSRLRALWDEFEVQQTLEAKFARTIDAFAPVLLHHAGSSHALQNHGVTASQVLERKRIDMTVAPELYGVVERLLGEMLERKLIDP
jgi:putative hydrolases of HD superfamily